MPDFKRPHHRAIAQLLAGLNAPFLSATHSYFAGGTRIALALGEYRESRDVDFLCGDSQGFKRLRETVGITDRLALRKGIRRLKAIPGERKQ